MTRNSRRTFVLQVIAGGLALGTASAQAQAPAPAAGPKLEENDPQAVALGYKQDTTKVDAKKYPNHTPAQMCGTCQLYTGKPKEPMGGCPLFGNKQVMAGGWCSAWTKKA